MKPENIKFLKDNEAKYNRFLVNNQLGDFDIKTAGKVMQEEFRPTFILDANNHSCVLNLVKDLYTLYGRYLEEQA